MSFDDLRSDIAAEGTQLFLFLLAFCLELLFQLKP
jgi:hypothetical protein